MTILKLPDVTIKRTLVSRAWNTPLDAYGRKREVYYSAWSNPYANNPIYEINMPELFPTEAGGYDTFDEHMVSALTAMIQAFDENQYNQASANFARLAEEKLRKRIAAYLAVYKLGYEKIDGAMWGAMPIGMKFLSPEEETEKWNKEFERWMTEERQAFETFIKEFRDFVLALAKDPPETSSGLTKPRKRTQIHYLTHPRETITHPRKTITHPQRTYADMLNELANQLVDLPDYVARVKIKGEPEHLIQTLDPKKQADKPLYGQLLNDRVERIKLHNRTEGYTRPRQDVENEISMRQDALRQAAQPQKPVTPVLDIKRRIPLEPQPVQQTTSNTQLEQAIATLTPERHEQERLKDLTTLENFEEWREQEAQKILSAWLKKKKVAQ